MDEEKRTRLLSSAERLKGAAMCVVGIVIAGLAIKNYIKVSNATFITEIEMPRILEWAYDTLGLVPGVCLQIVLGLALVGYGIHKIRSGK